MKLRDAFTFDDVLLVPKFSRIETRSSIDLEVKCSTRTEDFVFGNPLVPANMVDVVDEHTIRIFLNYRMLTIMHRFHSDNTQNQIDLFVKFKSEFGEDLTSKLLAFSIGVHDIEKENIKKYVDAGCKIICIDIAHGHSAMCFKMIRHIKLTYPNILIIAGNVATAGAADDLWTVGADIVKVGIGPGSICTTRIETGNGVPQMTALEDIYNARTYFLRDNLDRKVYIISDGGIKSSGDCVKALCFADMVMIGNLFAFTHDSPGKLQSANHHDASNALVSYSGSSTLKSNYIEGITITKQVTKLLNDVINQLRDGIRSGCSYQNVDHVQKLQIDPEFVRVTRIK